ncbi:hypothetical protein SO802_016731 [Lithocarpus litseifolius]|uniref:Uncharacterized protein n=1 Tax=Lithocarpus litseifolius TaxID=425828 RepID=A0AAW2D1H0_9ROSI
MISPPKLQLQAIGKARAKVRFSAKMAAGTTNEVHPPRLDSSSEPPQVFDGTTRPAWYKEKVYSVNKDPDKKEFAEELLTYGDGFTRAVISAFKGDGNEADTGKIWKVDIAYAPFIERYQPLLLGEKKYDIIAGRPKLAAWINVR